MNKDELAELYGVSPKTLRDWLKTHNLFVPYKSYLPYQVCEIVKVIGLPPKINDRLASIIANLDKSSLE